jgi:hypothetical protein
MKTKICLFIVLMSLCAGSLFAQKVNEDEPIDANISRINFIEPPIVLELPTNSQITDNNPNNKTEKIKKVTLSKYSGVFEDKIPDFDFFRLKERKLNHEGKNFKGYRVQIYSGLDNNEAQRVRSDFLLKQQNKYNTYNTYEQPYYRLRVGDFTQYWHARKLQQDIVKDFPNAMIIQDNINLPNK